MSHLTPENNELDFKPEAFPHKIDLKLDSDLEAFSLNSGVELAPLKKFLAPKFQRLWASALTRSINDQLVVEDSLIFPYLDTDKIIIIKNSEGEIPVFFSYHNIHHKGDNATYLHICLIDQKYQGRGLIKSILGHVIKESSSKFIALTTQNEHMVQALRPFCPKGLLYPIDAPPTSEIKTIAESLIKTKNMFDEKTFVRKSTYSNGSPLYGDRVERHSKHLEIREYFEKNINFQNGDALLIIGKIPYNL